MHTIGPYECLARLIEKRMYNKEKVQLPISLFLPKIGWVSKLYHPSTTTILLKRYKSCVDLLVAPYCSS
jgi:hypothetical protein